MSDLCRSHRFVCPHEQFTASVRKTALEVCLRRITTARSQPWEQNDRPMKNWSEISAGAERLEQSPETAFKWLLKLPMKIYHLMIYNKRFCVCAKRCAVETRWCTRHGFDCYFEENSIMQESRSEKSVSCYCISWRAAEITHGTHEYQKEGFVLLGMTRALMRRVELTLGRLKI